MIEDLFITLFFLLLIVHESRSSGLLWGKTLRYFRRYNHLVFHKRRPSVLLWAKTTCSPTRKETFLKIWFSVRYSCPQHTNPVPTGTILCLNNNFCYFTFLNNMCSLFCYCLTTLKMLQMPQRYICTYVNMFVCKHQSIISSNKNMRGLQATQKETIMPINIRNISLPSNHQPQHVALVDMLVGVFFLQAFCQLVFQSFAILFITIVLLYKMGRCGYLAWLAYVSCLCCYSSCCCYCLFIFFLLINALCCTSIV